MCGSVDARGLYDYEDNNYDGVDHDHEAADR
jgi:hypothetical protein